MVLCDVGELTALEVWHDGHGESPGWHLSSVEVENVTMSRRASFVCNDWLHSEMGDRKTRRVLSATDRNPLAHKINYKVRVVVIRRAGGKCLVHAIARMSGWVLMDSRSLDRSHPHRHLEHSPCHHTPCHHAGRRGWLQVTTFTADRKHAGTDARVSLTLHGDALDATLPHLLTDSNHSEPFARNQVRGRCMRIRISVSVRDRWAQHAPSGVARYPCL
jgi:hypothetical protein